MGSFATALNKLSALLVTGVKHNYGISAVPDTVSRAQLPALLTLPLVAREGLFPDRGVAFEALAFSDGARTVTYTLTHLLLVAPVTQGKGMRSSLPPLVDLIDAYFAALSDDVMLDGALVHPMRVRVEAGVFEHGETRYYGCAFRHEWVIQA